MDGQKHAVDQIGERLRGLRLLWLSEHAGDPDGVIWLKRMEAIEHVDDLIRSFVYGADADEVVQPSPSVSRETPKPDRSDTGANIPILMNHVLKSHPVHFGPVLDGSKRAEIRRNDRNFAVGDRLELHEWEFVTGMYTGRSTECRITHIDHGGAIGLEPGFVVLSIVRVSQ